MNRLDMFAAAALQGLLTQNGKYDNHRYECIVRESWEIAILMQEESLKCRQALNNRAIDDH